MKKILILPFLLTMLYSSITFGQAVTPQLSGSNYSFQVGNVYLEIDPAFGGRIIHLKLNDKEILYTTTGVNFNSYGSTFWPSPQKPWSWPPISELDSKQYSGGIKNNKVDIISGISSKLSLKIRKIFSANLTDTSITIDYYIFNAGTSQINVAPWEITRVPVGGTIFFPDSGDCTGLLTSVFSKIGDLQWADHSGASPGQTPKLMANSKEGWIGWLNSDSAVFVKQFPNIQKSDAASEEQEVEFYYHGPGYYYELENQGKLFTLVAGDSLKWTTKWYVRKLPVSVDKSKGSVGLVDFVRKTIGPVIALDTPNLKPKPAGLNNLRLNNEITVSPNPANQKVMINGLKEPSTVKIFDITGKAVLKQNVNFSNNYINVIDLKEGIYFYNVLSDKKNISGKLIIKR